MKIGGAPLDRRPARGSRRCSSWWRGSRTRRRRQRPLRPRRRAGLRRGARPLRPALVRGAVRSARLRAAGASSPAATPAPIATGENLFSMPGRPQPGALRRAAARPRRDPGRSGAGLRPGRVPARDRHAARAAAGRAAACIPHGGHQMALRIAAGLGLGGNESYPGVFQPFGGFADDMPGRGRRRCACPTCPASASSAGASCTRCCNRRSSAAAGLPRRCAVSVDTVEEIGTDPFLLEVVRGHLVMTCEEMGLAMMRTSLSPIFNEGRDFSCALFDARGEMVAQGDFCPAHIGAIVHVVEWCIREVGVGGLDRGDVVLHNDPFRGGCHLPEFMVLRPVFFGERLVGFAANIAHMPDVGGMVPGAFGDTRSIFQEGLRLPPVKVVRGDCEVEDLFRVILSNIRGPRSGYGDLKAMIGSLYLGERRVLELVERYGADAFDGFCRDVKLVSERMARRVIERLPDGEWVFEGFIEDDGVLADQRWRIRSTVVVRGDELIVDFSGSSVQSQGPANQTFGATASGAYAAVFNILGDVPFNHGCYRPISIIAPPGSFVNVEYPGSCVGGNTDSMPTTIDVVLGAICELAGKGTAADGDTYGILTFNGIDPRSGEDFTMVYYDRPGWGGRLDADGNDAMGCKNGNGSSMPIEVIETRYPIQVTEYGLNTTDVRPTRRRHPPRRLWPDPHPAGVRPRDGGERPHQPTWSSRGGETAAARAAIAACSSAWPAATSGRPPSSSSAPAQPASSQTSPSTKATRS